MSILSDFAEEEITNKVYRVRKAIYRLKQSPST